MSSWMPGSLIAVALAAAGVLPVGESPRGVVYWHGHRLDPPYRVELRYRVEADTLWTGHAINGLTLEGLRDPTFIDRPNRMDATGFDPRRVATAADSAIKRAGRRMHRGEGGFARLLAEELRSFPDLVDSVLVQSAGEAVIH